MTSTLVISAHAADFAWRAGGAIALASSRGEQVQNLGYPANTMGEAYMRMFPQTTDRLG
jgi:LmbE family N-acetylglucosaminyl deacetylase